MPNNWFEFKQFMVQQDDASFKVGTDGCLLGAWANVRLDQRLLDVGTGTGLIALMSAQRSEANIFAIDRDPNNVVQAKTNFAASPWTDRLTSVEAELQSYEGIVPGFEHILCNPPYFKNSTPHQSDRTHTSRHDEHLSLKTLFTHAQRLSSSNGKLSIVFPYDRWAEMEELAPKHGWMLSRALYVRPSENKPVNRTLSEWSKQPVDGPMAEELVLYQKDRHYTDQARSLLKDYYLHL